MTVAVRQHDHVAALCPIFCLVDAPDADAAATVHRVAHGLVADQIFPVAEGV